MEWWSFPAQTLSVKSHGSIIIFSDPNGLMPCGDVVHSLLPLSSGKQFHVNEVELAMAPHISVPGMYPTSTLSNSCPCINVPHLLPGYKMCEFNIQLLQPLLKHPQLK